MESTYSTTAPRPSAARGRTTSCPRADPSYVARAAAPPTAFVIDLSNPLPFADSTASINYTGRAVDRLGRQLGGTADGNFGTLGQGGLGSTGHGFTHRARHHGHSLHLEPPAAPVAPADRAGGSGTRLVLTLRPGTTLPADYYRLYIPNQVDAGRHRHPDLRHLRQPARRRVPGQPDLELATSEFPGQLQHRPVPGDLQLRGSALERHLSPGHVRRRRRRRRVHDRLRGRPDRATSSTPGPTT